MQEDLVCLGQCIGFLATAVRQKTRAAFAEALKPYNLEYRQAGILWVCYHKPATQSFISQLGELDKNYARIFVDDLHQKGLIERVINPKNRREKLLVLTDEGKKLAKETFTLMMQSQEAIFSQYLSNEEIQTLQKLLKTCFVGIYQIDI